MKKERLVEKEPNNNVTYCNEKKISEECEMEAIPNSKVLIKLLEAKTSQWYDHFPDKEGTTDSNNKFQNLAICIHYCNFFQWDREGKIRSSDISPETIRTLKREIDMSNMERNELAEKLDEFCVSQLKLVERNDWSELFINSETLGQMVDRISILILKIFFMECYFKRSDLDSDMRKICFYRVNKLRLQLEYLSTCYDRFISHLRNGTGYMFAYKQFKFYKDEDLRR